MAQKGEEGRGHQDKDRSHCQAAEGDTERRKENEGEKKETKEGEEKRREGREEKKKGGKK